MANGNTSAGQLYEKVAFDSREQVNPDFPEDYGNTESVFTERFTRRAGFTYLRGTETVVAARLQGRQPIVVRVRSDSSTRQITPDWRMRDARNGAWTDTSETEWSGPSYAIKSIAPSEDRQWLDIMVESGVAA